ncbi:Phospho-2-dehydro-3-deoxyheptonate aldolase 1, chloroplastic [Senna tora]|uniref:Phospho-2-dehydro-3-deoxyheptonate aldolase 1, chloroplastic n=1 Tax=Senna tora TaxID=362788 RepID=A0A834X8Q0_9FABA|nr:Phospho-2-dehydro-3-deoxyheptonate aldolase 1, chloroplastic [Senna tora]
MKCEEGNLFANPFTYFEFQHWLSLNFTYLDSKRVSNSSKELDVCAVELASTLPNPKQNSVDVMIGWSRVSPAAAMNPKASSTRLASSWYLFNNPN